MFRGRYNLGDTVQLHLVTRNADGTATAPVRPPQVTVWLGGTKIVYADMPIREKFTQTGKFGYDLFLDGRFATGLCVVNYVYVVGSYAGQEDDNFEITAGGDADGNVVGMYFYSRPHADFIIHRVASGQVLRGRNPTF